MINKDYLKQKIVDLISPINPLKVILFGSYAYGNPTEDSDVDICVVEESVLSRITETMHIRELLKPLNVALDVLVSSFDEFEFYKNEYCSVYREVYEKGEVLWQRNS